MNMDNYEEILKYAKCDIMDADRGCCANFTDLSIPTDNNNHFMHPLLMDLSTVKTQMPKLFKKILQFRYNNLYSLYDYYKIISSHMNYYSNNNIKLLVPLYIRKSVQSINMYIVEECLLHFAHELLIVTDNNLSQIQQFVTDLHENNHNFMKNIYLLNKTIDC